MKSRFDQLTKGLLSLAVILMFAAAVIADQARANLPAEVPVPSIGSLPTQLIIILDNESLQIIDLLLP